MLIGASELSILFMSVIFFIILLEKSFTLISPFMISEFGLTLKDIGFLIMVFSIAYGIGKFASGVLCDRSNPRYFMAVGLILTGFCNIFFGLSSSIFWFTIFWVLNGLFQGWGWPACTKQLTYWFSRSERGTWWSACTTSHYVGGIIIAYVAVHCAKWNGWRTGMFVPGVVCLFVGLWLLERLRDTPRSLGLPTVEKFKGEEEKSESQQPASAKEIFFDEVLKNKAIWILAIAYFFIYVVRIAANDFAILFLVQEKGFDPVLATNGVVCFEIGGFLGVLIAGWSSDYFFQGKRIPCTVISSFALMFSTIGLWYLPYQSTLSYVLASSLLALIGIFVSAPVMLIGLAAAEFVSKKAASTSNGFAGFFGYLGAAGIYPLSLMIETWGWYSFIVALVGCSALTTVILLPMWSSRGEKTMIKPVEENPMLDSATT